jgi:hypothetical protein
MSKIEGLSYPNRISKSWDMTMPLDLALILVMTNLFNAPSVAQLIIQTIIKAHQTL